MPPLPSSMVAVTLSAFLSSLVTLAPVMILMPCFSNALRANAGDLGVLDRQDLRQHLDHRHLGAERAVERGELDADRARADDQQRLRHAVRRHRLEIGPDQLLVGLEPGQHARPRAGRDDDVLGLIGARPERALRRFAPARPSRVILPGASMRASPQITVTLFFFIRKPTPSLSRFDTPRERFTTAAGSNDTLSADRP